jgi:RHS repeat-associated protein
MRKLFFMKGLTGIALLLLLCTVARAQDPPVIKVLSGIDREIDTGRSVTVQDDKCFDLTYRPRMNGGYAVRNIISFEFNEGAPVYIPGNFKDSVLLEITTSSNWNDTTITSTTQQWLWLAYNAGGAYQHRNTFVLGNAYRVKVKVVKMISDAGWYSWRALKVVNELQSFPSYKFTRTGNAITQVSDSAWAANTNYDELPVWWTPSIGADEYDLEWAYVDSSSLAVGRYGSETHPDMDRLFDNNATRVSVTGTAYRIPLLYDAKGHLFYRVRAVQAQAGSGRNEAIWTTSDAVGHGRFNYNGHEGRLNWQATTSFAEEGKRKSVLQYYDGSLRGRQTVTKDNSVNRTIVAESFYDYQGRPVVQVLPAPTLNSLIRYTPNFNRALDTLEYYKNRFDSLSDPGLYCTIQSAPMDTLSGASQYYSPNSPYRDSGVHKYVPNAAMFPFTETEYTQDNTGRINRQGGVGKDFRLGSGHETKYMYATPGQQELDALFGTEIGHYSHYFKNLVRDANGQYSISYVDMHGRTIATALAGTPDSVKLGKLASNSPATRTESLVDPASSVIKDLVMESQKSLAVTTAGAHTFRYSLSPQSFKEEGCKTDAICYDCLYDLQITITDDCNNQKLPDGKPYQKIVRNFMLNAIDTISGNGTGFDLTFVLDLPEGNYEITKQLSVSRYALDYYRDSVYLRDSCRTLDNFIAEQRALWQQALECKPTCDGCLAGVGNWSQFWQQFRSSNGIADVDSAAYRSMGLEAYDQAVKACVALCDSSGEEVSIRQSMLMDMTPSSGQYANINNAEDRYSVFFSHIDSSDNNRSKDTLPGYTLVHNYRDEEGNPEKVLDEDAGVLVEPGQLSPELFVQRFKPGWAEALLPKHPEYGKLVLYEQLKASTLFDKKFEATDTYAQAKAKGYLNPLGLQGMPAAKFGFGGVSTDPLYTFNSYFPDKLEDSLREYRLQIDVVNEKGKKIKKDFTLWNIATLTVACPPQAAHRFANGPCYINYSDTTKAFDEAALCAGELDMAWRAYRQMYLDIKRSIVNNWITDNCDTCKSAAQIFASGHQPHFSDARELMALEGPPDMPQDEKEGKALQEQYYDANCKAYAERWIQQLGGCTLYSETELRNTIIPALIYICREGADETHPYGASSVKPSSGLSVRSFDAYLKQYNASHGIADTLNCNAYRITAPKPYDQQASPSAKPLYEKPDSCECNTIARLYVKYVPKATLYGSFSTYLKQVYQTTIADSTLNQLLGLCGHAGFAAPDCDLLSQPINLPPLFQCNTSEVCVDCVTFQELDVQFRQEFPTKLPALSDGLEHDSLQLAKNKLYAQFMNYKLGYSLTAYEYLAFREQCGATSTTTPLDSLRRDTLLNIARDFKNEKWQTYGAATVLRTAEVPNEFFYDPHAIIKNGVVQFPDSVQERTSFASYHGYIVVPAANKKYCWTDGYTTEVRFKMTHDDAPGVRDIFYFGNTNITATFSRRITGLYLVGIEDAYGFRYGSNFGYYKFDSVLVSSNRNMMMDWVTLKLKVTPVAYSIYVNGALVKQMQRDTTGPLKETSVIGQLEIMSRHAVMDWIRLTDANGKVRYFEDYNDPDNLALPDQTYICPAETYNCQAAFTTYFNTQRGTSYTYAQIDSVYFAVCGQYPDVCTDTTPSCDKLTNLLADYRKQALKPSSGIADLPMRTFAGNKTIAEGPKGVFDIYENFIGNTVDGTVAQINASFVQIWNSSPVNQAVGALSALPNGLFRLALKPGQTVPCNGVIGMRYYQFDIPADSLDALIVGAGCFVDFGDGYRTKVKALVNNTTRIAQGIGPGGLFPTYVQGFTPYHNYSIKHGYSAATDHTVTLYHSDESSRQFFFDCGQDCNYLTGLKNLRGYVPPDILNFGSRSTQDSTFNRTSGIRNFSEVGKVEGLILMNGGVINTSTTDFLNANFGSLENFHNLRALWIVNSLEVPIATIKPLSDYLPDLPRNFRELRLANINPYDSLITYKLDFTLPNLNNLSVRCTPSMTSTQIDRLIHMVATGSLQDSGSLNILDAPVGRTSASNADIDSLIARHWYIRINSTVINNATIPTYPVGVNKPEPDSIRFENGFTDFMNARLGTQLNLRQIMTLYQVKCGAQPDYCSLPGSNLTLCGRAEPVFRTIALEAIDNCSDSTFFILSKAQDLYGRYTDSLKGHFDSLYRAKCLQAYKYEKFTVSHTVSEYHYTLYYYDQAGNLVKTIPPAGVMPNYDSVWLESVAAARTAKQVKVPAHALPTQYRYNTLNQVTTQKSPDGGKTDFWYDRLGRLALSRNARQLAMGNGDNRYYSYTRYDTLGRITEVGQLRDTLHQVITDTFTRNETLLGDWFAKLYNKREQVTGTVYDTAYTLGGLTPDVVVAQQNLRNRVSYVSYYENPGTANAYNHRSYYSYDIHGNVDTLLQDYGMSMNRPNLMNENGNRFKKFVYEYDLISGKVNKVMYQTGWNDQWMHRYYYDAENRLTEVETSTNGYNWEREAKYEYYLHGPLARTILGQQQVQGIDYAYTLQGWLKGINSTGGTQEHDIGGDARIGSLNQYVALDAVGLNLNYFGGDYKPINSTVTPFPAYRLPAADRGLHDSAYRPLYNGNISSMAYYNRQLEIGSNGGGILYAYQYDQLNRLLKQDAFAGFDRSGNNYNNSNQPLTTFSSTFREELSYDANGNIQTVNRNGVFDPSGMDRLSYNYYPGTNKLKNVDDAVYASKYGSGEHDVILDIDDQPDSNYVYDQIGNLIKDSAEKISSIKWNVYGKITEINRAHAGKVVYTKIEYGYDAQGNRISKVATNDSLHRKEYTWYVRDAQGNLMGAYGAFGGLTTPLDSLFVGMSERHVYGSSRLGILSKYEPLPDGPITMQYQQLFGFDRGMRQYELTNHLGNVLSTISDKKFGVPLNDSLTSYYTPDIINSNDYYAFGMVSRIAGTSYRYGFNGKETDNEVKGFQNQQDYGMRIYDPRIGRFLSVDPLARNYPEYSSYQYAGNSPIANVDLDGAEEYYYNAIRKDGQLQLKLTKVVNQRSFLGISWTPDKKAIVNDVDNNDTYNFLLDGSIPNEAWNDIPTWNYVLETGDLEAATSISEHRRRNLERTVAAIAVSAGDLRIKMDVNKRTASRQTNPKAEVEPEGSSKKSTGSTISASSNQATSANSGNKAAAAENIENNSGNFVYRGLSNADKKTMQEGRGILARNPSANNDVVSHIAGKKSSRWISTTKSEEIAKRKYGENGYIKIDLSKVKSDKVDMSKGIPSHAGGRLTNYAKKDQEVLIEKVIPQQAIINP